MGVYPVSTAGSCIHCTRVDNGLISRAGMAKRCGSLRARRVQGGGEKGSEVLAEGARWARNLESGGVCRSEAYFRQSPAC